MSMCLLLEGGMARAAKEQRLRIKIATEVATATESVRWLSKVTSVAVSKRGQEPEQLDRQENNAHAHWRGSSLLLEEAWRVQLEAARAGS